MDPSRKQAKEREFFDVHTVPKHHGKFGALIHRISGRRSHTVNLQPGRLRRYRRFVPFAIGVAVLAVAFLAVRLFTKAEVHDYYPAVCLGTWENAIGASGQPENFDQSSAAETFTNTNSAIYRLPQSDIYCGGFLPPTEETKGNITNVALTLIWHVGELQPSSAPIGVVETPPSVPLEDATDTPSGAEPAVPADESGAVTPPPAENVPPPAGEVPTGTPAAPEPSEPSAYIAPISSPIAQALPKSKNWYEQLGQAVMEFVSSRVFAQEEATPAVSADAPAAPPSETPPPPPAEQPAPEVQASPTPEIPAQDAVPQEGPASSSGQTIVLPPLTTTLAPLATSTDNETAIPAPTGTAMANEPTPPDEHFLKVSYSVNGESWFEIGKVSMANWQNFTVRLPVSSWSELKNLQISVQDIPTTLNPIPPVYLAGMFVEVNYELPPIFLENVAEDQPTAPDGIPIVTLSGDKRPVPAGGRQANWNANEAPTFDFDLGGISSPAAISAPEDAEPAPPASSETPATPAPSDAMIPPAEPASPSPAVAPDAPEASSSPDSQPIP
ncbi:MAG: hypothetical protein RL681_624 [Candidatus Parcubacteria bacterium]|jgi:hypothetical protein